MEIKKVFKENFYKDINDNDINISLIEEIKGLPRTRKDVYENYRLATEETNNLYIFEVKVKHRNEECSKIVIFEKSSPEDMVIEKFDTLDDAYKSIRFRERYMIDIFQELKLFNLNVKIFENANAINIDMCADVVKSKNKEKYYTFNIYLKDELIAREVPNIYSLDISELVGDKDIEDII